jgi:ketosteroid isomerase-like protein
VKAEEKALRQNFKRWRAAFNKGDGKALMAMFTPKCDAIPVFSFLDGRAQILNGRTAVGDKAERMNPGAAVSNPNPNARNAGAALVDGEPKVVRFLSPTLAVVDGTAHISGIPNAHGFAPSEMKGVYMDVWRKVGGNWQIESSRAWF